MYPNEAEIQYSYPSGYFSSPVMRHSPLSSTEVVYYCSPSFQTDFLYQFVFTYVVTLAFIPFLSCQVSSRNIHQWKIGHLLKCFSRVTFTAVQLYEYCRI